MILSSNTLNLIRPITDLRTNINDILELTSSTKEPVILTKNGFAKCAIMSIPAFNDVYARTRVAIKLREAEIRSRYQNETFSYAEVADRAIQSLIDFGVEADLARSIPTPECMPGAPEVRFQTQALEDLEDLANQVTTPQPIEYAIEAVRELFTAFPGVAKPPRRIIQIFQDDALDRTYRRVTLERLWIYYTLEDGMIKVWRVILPESEILDFGDSEEGAKAKA